MGNQEFLNICKAKVAEYYNEKKDKTDLTPVMTVDDVFVVWYSKSLQNHKALLSTQVSDGMYYELTYISLPVSLLFPSPIGQHTENVNSRVLHQHVWHSNGRWYFCTQN